MEPSSSTLGRSHTPPLGNISREITRALDLLKGQTAKEPKVAQSFYGPLRTDSLWMDGTRAIEFSVECSKILILLCPKTLTKCGLDWDLIRVRGC